MSKKLKRSAVALVLAATMVFSSQGVLTAFAVGENETSTAVDVSALEPILDKEETVVVEKPGNTDETETPEVEVCEECQGVNGNHAETCPHYVDPNTPPENPTDDENNNNQEQQECTCGAEEGQPHEEGCPLYEEATIPECTCGAEEGQPHEEGCPLYEEPTVPECTCGAEEGQPHQEGCPLYEENTEETQEPSEEDVAAVQAVVDVINSLPTTDDLANYTPTIELKPEDEGYQEAYQAALDAYYSQVQEKVKAARAAYDALTEEQKAAFDATVLAKLTALEELIAMREQADVLPNEDTVAMIGRDEYSSLNSAITAAPDNGIITLVKDCSLTSVTNLGDRSITIDGGSEKHHIDANGTHINVNGNLTFQNVSMDVYNAPQGNWMYFYLSQGSSLEFVNSTVTVDGSNAPDNCTVMYYPEPYQEAAHFTLDNSSFIASNCDGNGISWGGRAKDGFNTITVINGSTLDISHCAAKNASGGGGIIGTFEVTVTDSTLKSHDNSGYGSNGSHFIIENSDVNFSNNGSHGLSAGELSIDNSSVTCERNGGMGISVNNNFEVKNNSTVTVTENALKNTSDFAYAAVRLYNNHIFTVDKTSKLYINNNHNTGLYVRQGNLTVEDGAVLEIIGNNVENNLLDGYGGGIYVGYGDNYDPTVVLPADAKIYNNHALVGGDDIYVSEGVNGPSLTFGKVGEGWTLDGDPDCTDAITGWFDDSEGNRWEAHDAPLHVSEFTDFNDAGIATISGLTALKAAHPYLTPEIEPGDPDVPSSDWPISKSKTAENLDENFESKVTLSLPADSYKPSVDVVMVMDVSSSMKGEDITEAKAAATAMCDELASKTNANVNIGIVTFDKEAHNLTNGLVSIEEAKNAINNIEASDDTNMMAGLIAGKAMLDAGTATDKYLVIMSDGIPIYWVEDGKTISKTLIRYAQDKKTELERSPAGSEPEGSAPEDFDSMLSIEQLLSITDWDTDSNEWKQVSDTGENINPDCKYTNIQKATYKTAQYMIDNIFGQYKIKMVAFGTDKYENNVVYKYGENLCDWIGDQDGVSYYKVSKPNYGGEAGDLVEAFTDIANEMIYLVDAGSQVVDEIGFGTYEDGTEYDFDFVNEISKLELTVGGKALDKVQIDDYTYGFGPDSTLPKDYQFIVTYYPNGLTRSVAGELFVWDIYVPITIDDKVQLTYSVKLNDPRTDDGEYGIYDPDGSENRNGLYTNNAAVLYPVDSNGNNGEPEAFDKPTVSYTVSNGKPVEPTPTPDPDPTPDRPSRPNRDDDDDWEPLPNAPVKDKPTTEVDVPEETETPTTEQPDKYNPETGDTTTVFAAMALAAVSLGGVVLLGRKKK